jgi:deoxynucleoside triphosphate triphosphohydrolase SAMHD1
LQIASSANTPAKPRPPPKKLTSFRDSLEAWTSSYLDGYVAGLSTAPADAKEFNDPVWGTILLNPVELIVLDSPLLQRLRNISQLGVVHLVYPAATHTRLQHTLGVVHQIEGLVDSINDHYSGTGQAVSDEQLALLRLTALCHDVGHGALSHVSENALSTLDQVQDVRLEFAEDLGIEDASFAEIASYYMVGSKSFRKLLKRAQELVPDHGLGLTEQAVETMQRAIVGQGICDKVPLLHELISGPFDADKLDYMTRDAHMTGVPVVTDIPRLVQKVRAVEVSRDQLRPEIAETVTDGLAYYIVTGIAFSGGRTVDELILGRTLQEDKLYRHHKVRAIEAMVASIYQQLNEIEPDAATMLPYRLRDGDFAYLNHARIEEVIDRSLEEAEKIGPAAVAVDLASRLQRRDLFVRAYAFALGMPLDPYRADPAHFAGLERLARESGSDFIQRGQLIDAIVEEIRAALAIADEELLNRYPDIKPYIWLDPLYASPETNDSARAYLISEHSGPNKVIRFQDDYAETVRWASAYILTRDAGYVFAPDDLAIYAYVATEKVLRRDYEIRTPVTMQMYAKQSDESLSALKLRLHEANYYEGIAYDVRPMPDRLTKADIAQRVDALCTRLKGYEGPVRGGSAEKKHSLLSPERVFAWLRQFPPQLDDKPLQLLEELRFIGRREIVTALAAFVADERGKDFLNGAICPLGDPKDSSAVTAYWSGDGQAQSGLPVLSVGDALSQPDRPLVFVEDFIGSGQQSVSILEAWLGAPPSTALNEKREPLDPDVAETLKKRKLAFVFAAGQKEGRELLEEKARSLELDAVVYVHDESIPRAFPADGDQSRDDLAEFCGAVGKQLLLDPAADHDEQWVAERVLGYGNNAFLVLFGYNTPSQSLTCLWKDGSYEGVPWMALFPRRSKA